MAKKTRKEKIIADLRRKVLLSHQFSDTSTAQQPNPEIFSPREEKKLNKEKPESYPPPLTSNYNQTQSLYIYPLQLVRKDLTKTLLLSILAISLEIALFLILEKHLILPFRIKF